MRHRPAQVPARSAELPGPASHDIGECARERVRRIGCARARTDQATRLIEGDRAVWQGDGAKVAATAAGAEHDDLSGLAVGGDLPMPATLGLRERYAPTVDIGEEGLGQGH